MGIKTKCKEKKSIHNSHVLFWAAGKQCCLITEVRKKDKYSMGLDQAARWRKTYYRFVRFFPPYFVA